MKYKRTLSTVAGLGFLFALGIRPAGAAMVPTPCPTCDQKNAQHGDGKSPAIYKVDHLCDTSTGEAGLQVWVGNPTAQIVSIDISAVESGGIIGQRWTGFAPPFSTSKATMATHRFLDIDRDHNIVLTGTIGTRSIGSQLYQCPCDTPDTTTTVVSSPPSSGGPPATTPGTRPGVPTIPHGSTPGQTLTGDLPATGGVPWGLVFGGVALAAAGGLVLLIATSRKPEDV